MVDNTADEVVEAVDTQDEADVDLLLKRETADGSGLANDDEAALPESDFESFSEEGVEED